MTVTKFEIERRDGTESFDISGVTSNIKWTNDLNFSAGSLTFDMLMIDDGVTPKSGDVVKFAWNEKKLFYGYIFKVSFDQSQKYSITAYDKLRYFKNQDSLVWQISTISQRFEKIAKMAEVKYQVINDAKLKLPAEVADQKTYFDMLKSSIEATLKSSNQMYFVFARYDTVQLRKAPFYQLENVVGDDSLLTGYTFDKSIDDAANVVRIVKEDKKESQTTSSTATAETTGEDPKNTSFSYVDVSGSTVKSWGKLQTVEKAKDKANEAQMKQRAKELLKQKNKETYTLKLTTLGNVDFTAGNAIFLKISDLDKAGFKIENAAILKATHNFGTDYTCDLEMKVNAEWLESSS